MSTPGDSGSGVAAGRSTVAGGHGSRAPTPSSGPREPTPSSDLPAAVAPTSAIDGQGTDDNVIEIDDDVP
ncbi:unnamed protein product, partial [Urochloa humidicola]